jgi:hypothetical protein
MTRHFIRMAALAALIAALAPPAAVRAEGTAGVDAAVKLLPADTAFYGSMLRNRDQLELVTRSKAWAKLMDLPAAKFARQLIEAKFADPDEQTAMVLGALKDPENKDLLQVLGEAVSEEIFVYGGSSWIDFSKLFQRINAANQFGRPVAMLKEGGGNPGEAQARVMLNALAANADLIRVPDLVIGFKVRDTKKAEAQIKRLESLVNTFIGLAPPSVRDGFKRAKVGDASVLNLTVDGSVVPWDEFHIKDYEQKEGQFDAFLKKLSGLKLSVSLGVYKSYLVLAIGENPQALAAIGGPGKRLSELPELEPLARHANRRLTSIGYYSKALAAAGQNSAEQMQSMLGSLGQLIDAADLPKDNAEKLHADLKWLAEQGKETTPAEPGASLSFSFLSERGTEGYGYQYGTGSTLDASRPLTLLDHAGGSPIFFGALRLKHDAKEGEKVDEARFKELLGHVEAAVLSKLDDEQKKKYEKVKKDVLPLLARLYKITAEDFWPSLDGQVGLVVDANWKSKQWHKEMPEFPEALPMLEVGIVVGVADADKLAKAVREYRALFNDAAKAARKLNDGEMPQVEWPEPKVEESGGFTFASHALPEAAGLDTRVAPTGGLSKRVAVLTLSRGHAERLLKATPMKFDGGPLADTTKPLASASVFNWPALVDAVGAWVEAGVRVANVPNTPPGPEGDVLKQVRTVLEVLKVYKGTTSATYLENGVMVTHSESVVRDLK